MKYTYAYKTPDGVRHEAAMNASSREEVFSALRAKGIKAIKVVAADGSKANGEVRGLRKRAVVTLVALAAAVAGVVSWWWAGRAPHQTAATSAAVPVAAVPGGRASTQAAITGVAALVAANSSLRHQIYGDPAIMESFERGDFGDALSRDGDRLLAVFAQPGRYMCAKGVSTRNLAPVAATNFENYASHELTVEKDVEIADTDSREVRELKQIVNGMREEMRGYLANGNGTPRSYWRRLNERTTSEMQIYERTRRELENEKSPEVWDEKNAALRRLGLRTIPNPNE